MSIKLRKNYFCLYENCYDAVAKLKRLYKEVEKLDIYQEDFNELLQDIVHEMDLAVHEIAITNRENLAALLKAKR